ncbi:hypothetical protein PQX77_004827 [Marasmius sp. AFHP31]|nr:hypothetical protein PQX77_004827 [Marasmius sp. AFHP31]
MPEQSPTPPAWLSNSQNPSHIQSALRILKQREDTRTRASYASIPQKTGHLRAHLQHIPKSTSDFYAVTAGYDEINQYRNRYVDVVPYDRTRVVVNPQMAACGGAGDDGAYLNADWVLERFGGKWWIAMQAPLPNTSHTFLSLIARPVSPPSYPSESPTRVRTVVQLTQNLEDGRRKAHPYFPETVGQTIIIPPEADPLGPPLHVTLIEQEHITEARCVRSTVSFTRAGTFTPPPSTETNIENESGPVTFKHLLYHAWPDRGVPQPEDRAGLLAFARLVDQTNRQPLSLDSAPGVRGDPDPPIVVGCSAGIGRTGSFIALSSLLRSHRVLQPPATQVPPSVLPPSPLGELPDSLRDDEVVQEVDSLREQRPGMVQRPEQLIVIYEILTAALNSPSSS